MENTENLTCNKSVPELDKKEKKRRTADQVDFRRRLIKYYAADKQRYTLDVEEDRKIWCPVSKKYLENTLVTAVHIVPHAIGEMNITHLFGKKNENEEAGHSYSEKNGLLLDAMVEKTMAKAQIAIVPADGAENSGKRLKVVVFDRSLLKKIPIDPDDFDWSTMDGRELEFKNDNRPDLRYLYFQFLLTLFRRRRLECTGWRSDLARYAREDMWGSPGKWLRGSSLRAIARRLGHEESLEGVLETSELPIFDDDEVDSNEEELIAEEVVAAYQSVESQAEKRFGEDEDEDEDTDEDTDEDDVDDEYDEDDEDDEDDEYSADGY